MHREIEADADPLLTFEDIFREEKATLFPGGEPGRPLAALCLSGGGIRSACFALGALQALARFGVLGQFHYLSTVSGGGYIGGWLTAWRKRAGNDDQVFQALNRLQADGVEPAEIVGIRADSNYLTPKLGLLSGDTWAVVALVVRNLVLNWLVFGPFFLGVLLIPRLFVTLVADAADGGGRGLVAFGAGALLFGLTLSLYGRYRTEGAWLTDSRFFMLVLSPIGLSAVLFTLGFADGTACGWPLWWVPLAGVLLYALAWAAAMVALRDLPYSTRGDMLWDFVAWTAGGAVAGATLMAGVHLIGAPPHEKMADHVDLMAIFGIAWAIVADWSGQLLYVGLTSGSRRGDMEREWLARSAGWFAAVGATWLTVAAIDLYGPSVLLWGWDSATKWLIGIGGLAGFVTLALGSSGRTAATTAKEAITGIPLTRLVTIAGLIFAMFLASALALVEEVWFCSGLAMQAVSAVLLIAGALGVSCFVNINRFSLHAVYRNRLIRAYLGSARAGQQHHNGDPFTHFDPDDNLRMAAALGADEQRRRLLHVVNLTLNVVSPNNLAWQERKAEPFTVTALACGNGKTGYRRTARFGEADGGISLGTALAISGAAVSPNRGYHSSPIVGMLLMLFNVRLGWWLGNPAGTRYREDGPRPGLWAALRELAGATKDDAPWIYLSDGGHFENLGLYEMVRRRCRHIVVCDAGCDPECAFEDLGNAVRKVFIDQGASIDFETLALKPRQDPPVPGVYCAVGTITYPGSATPGWLLYVKPGYHGTEPADIRSYAIAHRTFPHETTADQWFSESQLEAYRGLGAHIFERILNGGSDLLPGAPVPAIDDLETVHRRARDYLHKAQQQLDGKQAAAAPQPARGVTADRTYKRPASPIRPRPKKR